MLRRACLVVLLALALPAAAAAYSWPVRPFNKQHPIRGFFGDPRTVFENGVLAGGLASSRSTRESTSLRPTVRRSTRS
jgi:hypothetical protein